MLYFSAPLPPIPQVYLEVIGEIRNRAQHTESTAKHCMGKKHFIRRKQHLNGSTIIVLIAAYIQHRQICKIQAAKENSSPDRDCCRQWVECKHSINLSTQPKQQSAGGGNDYQLLKRLWTQPASVM